jgi:hypothetical protein
MAKEQCPDSSWLVLDRLQHLHGKLLLLLLLERETILLCGCLWEEL